nr:copper transporter [Actinomycetota bacterium]
VVGLVRANSSRSTVSTIDNADSSFGQVSTVLAVAGIAKSQVGQYGTGKGADALFPSPSS